MGSGVQKVDVTHLAEGDPRNLPFPFPGREVLALPRAGDSSNRREVNSGNVTVYASAKATGRGGICRLNLFAELLGQRSHVASAFVIPGLPPTSLIEVSGHVVDGWHLFAQGTISQIDLRVTMASQDCCGEPRVRVKKNNLIPPEPAEAEAAFNAQFVSPPMVPWGRENGLWQVQSANTVGAAPGATLTFLPQSRVTHLVAETTGNGSTFTFDDEFGNTIESFSIAAAKRIELFPNGDIQAGSLTVTEVDFVTVETVR